MDPLVLRFIERLTAVLIGGMAIYLGYYLFLRVPESRSSSGETKLPWGISIVLTRVGPGVFFALFGVITVGISLLRPMEFPAGQPATARPSSYAGSPLIEDPSARRDARVALRPDIARLNTIPKLLREDVSAHERLKIESVLVRAKLALMRPVWGTEEEGFGDFADFERWVLEGEQTEPPPRMQEALSMFHYAQQGSSP